MRDYFAAADATRVRAINVLGIRNNGAYCSQRGCADRYHAYALAEGQLETFQAARLAMSSCSPGKRYVGG